MSILTTNQLWKDTVELRKEYQEESKQQYADLFSKYFDEINAYIVHSRPLPTLSWCIHPIIIELDCYQKPIRTFFYSVFDMEAYSNELRADPIIRRFTKLCFYIQENVEPYSPEKRMI